MDQIARQALRERFASVKERFETAVRLAGRRDGDVRLVAVSKFHGPDMVRELAEAGQKLFGESYVQEGLAKQDDLADLNLEWHHIGHIQTNKARDVAGRFVLIHGLDSVKLAEAVARRVPAGTRQAVLIQVNIGQEAQKAGVGKAEVLPLAERVLVQPELVLHGLMCLPPYSENPEHSRPYFAALREERDRLEKRLGVSLPCLSMGMSGDFPQAVAEGATLVRIGTDIFGPRHG